jgi:Flp pilus assembly protein CpaB
MPVFGDRQIMKNIALRIILVVAMTVAAIAGTVAVSHYSANSAQVAAEPGTG